MSTSKTLQIILHSIFLLFFATTVYESTLNEAPAYKKYGGRTQFITLWGLTLLPIYFSIALLNDLFGSETKNEEDPNSRNILQKFRDTFFSGVMFPLASFVTLAFWGVYAVDRDLIYSKVTEIYIPRTMNHKLHTAPMIAVFVEMFLVHTHYTNRVKGILCIVGLSSLYQIWIFWIAFHTGHWVYPVLKVLSVTYRVAFIVFLNFVTIALYLIGEKINQIYWGKGPITGVERIKSQ